MQLRSITFSGAIEDLTRIKFKPPHLCIDVDAFTINSILKKFHGEIKNFHASFILFSTNLSLTIYFIITKITFALASN